MRLRLHERLEIAAIALAAAPINSAAAADISSQTLGDGYQVIMVIGDVEAGDEEKFRELTLKFPKAVIALDSPGGAVRPALEIGRMISLRSNPTVVLEKSVCASACALMWLAGSPRFLEPGGRLGFHASYRDVDGRRIESGVANALVGHYLSQLNLSQRAVIFATSASPNEITWLTAQNQGASGIDFESMVPVTQRVEPPKANAVLRAGAPVALRLMEEITTEKKSARVGQRFMLEVAAPVEVNGVVVIPAGTPAWGEVTGVRNKGMWGKSGKLDARLLYLRVDGRQIRLAGTFDDKGVTGTAGVVGAVVLIPIAGFFMTGTSAKLPKGGAVSAFIDEDVVLAFKPVAAEPMQVPVSAPAMEVSTPMVVPTPAPAPASAPPAT